MSDEPTLQIGRRTRVGVAILLVAVAISHVVFPKVAIDGVFLGLLALAVIVLKFDIKSIDVFGVKATARALAKETEGVKAAEISTITPPALTPPPTRNDVQVVEHRPPFELMPPSDKATRILWSAEQIRVELIVLAGNRGLLNDARPWDAYRSTELAALLRREGVLPEAMLAGIRSVVEQRNLLAHARLGGIELLDPLDELAVTLVERLRELPRDYIRVRRPDLAIYRDRSLTARHPLSRAVMLEQRDKDGKLLVVQVFPTERTYARKRFVTWEWDFSRGSDEEAWYLDPETDTPKLAFSSSASFAGREYPEQWGLEYRGGPLLDDGVD